MSERLIKWDYRAKLFVVAVAVGLTSAALALAWLGQDSVDEGACKRRLVHAYQQGETLTGRPAECANVDDDTLERIAGEIVTTGVAP